MVKHNSKLPTTCVKRDGATVPFDGEKIVKAIRRCFDNVWADERTLADKSVDDVVGNIYGRVLNVIAAQKADQVSVEDVQRFVLHVLWSDKLYAAAEHYQNYREDRRKARFNTAVTPDRLETVKADQKHFPTDLQYYQFIGKFSRWRDADRRRETWKETVTERVMPWFKGLPGAQLEDAEWSMLQDSMYNLESSPAMRVVQMAGPALQREPLGCYNCLGVETAFITRNGVKTFRDFKDGDTTVVLTHTGSWKNAVVRNYGVQKLYTHHINRSRTKVTVRATANHRWVLSDGSVQTGLKAGDKLHLPPCPSINWNYDAAEPLEKLYWAYGYVYGDGTRVKKDGEYTYSMVRLCKNDRGYLERFEELGFGSSNPLSCKGDPIVYTGSYLKTLPELTDDLGVIRAFVRGYLDADGGSGHPQSPNDFSCIQVTGEQSIEFVRRVFPVAGYYITREEVVDKDTNFGPRSALTIRFGLTNNFGVATNRFYGLTSNVEDDGSPPEEVWCLEVEDDHSFVLPSGVVTGNCAYAPIVDRTSFSELLYVLMQGTGMGFSVENDYIDELPRIKKQRNTPRERIVVPDSTEGWCKSYDRYLELLWDGREADIDVSFVRKAGSRLKTKGGKASGPGPFLELCSFASNLFKSRQGKYLTDLDCHDLACMTGRIVQVGGVRRAAEISLSDLNSRAMRDAKSGAWWTNNPQRSMANNSAVYEEKPDSTTFMEEWLALTKSRSGERGIFNRQAAQLHKPKRRKMVRFGVNPCAEILLSPHGLCNLSMCIARQNDTAESLRRKVRAATYFGKLQSLCTNFNYVRSDWKRNAEEERLLGVDITGQADCPLLRFNSQTDRAALLRTLQEEVLSVDRMLAERWGINVSAAATTVKPGGDSAVFFDCSSGVSPRFSRHQIRWVRESKDSPVARFLIDSGVPHAPAPEAPDRLLVFGFPKAAPTGCTLRDDMTVIDQLENWLTWKENWAEHSVSATIYVGDDEWLTAGNWVYNHFDQITGLSFLPRDNGTYTYAPNEEIDEAKYGEMMNSFPDLNWAKLSAYEEEDMTEAAITFACVGGGCDN